MNKVSKKIFLYSVFALYCSWAEGCCENSQVISEFEKLHKIDFENDLKKIDEFKKSTQERKIYLQKENAIISTEKKYGYKGIAEEIRLSISEINAMLRTVDRIKQYMSASEKQKIKEDLQRAAEYCPIVRNLVKEVVGFGCDLSTSSSSGGSSEEKKKENVAADGENITNFNASNKSFSKTEDMKLTGEKEEQSDDREKEAEDM